MAAWWFWYVLTNVWNLGSGRAGKCAWAVFLPPWSCCCLVSSSCNLGISFLKALTRGRPAPKGSFRVSWKQCSHCLNCELLYGVCPPPVCLSCCHRKRLMKWRQEGPGVKISLCCLQQQKLLILCLTGLLGCLMEEKKKVCGSGSAETVQCPTGFKCQEPGLIQLYVWLKCCPTFDWVAAVQCAQQQWPEQGCCVFMHVLAAPQHLPSFPQVSPLLLPSLQILCWPTQTPHHCQRCTGIGHGCCDALGVSDRQVALGTVLDLFMWLLQWLCYHRVVTAAELPLPLPDTADHAQTLLPYWLYPCNHLKGWKSTFG